MATNKHSSQVVFFLGAGASVNAGVPDTYAFVNKFIDSIQEIDKKETVEKIVQILKEWKGTDIDIELLLETLTKLKNKEQEPLLRFFEGGDFILRGYSEKEPLIDDLKDFIKSKAIVSEEKIKYLLPFLWFIEEFRPFDIISLNYDTCVEQFCSVHKLIYQDGFDVHWNLKSFATENTDIRLYKLHGSVMWYQSDRGGYIKLPVMTEESKIQLITGEKAENLMLYPMQKWDYAEPLLELLVEIKRLLESNTCMFLVVVGYSFRDDHIRRILWDAARKNKALHLILIDPKAYQIYSEKLKYYNAGQNIPSSLDGRVVCLPYKFEKVFRWIKNHYLKYLQEALKADTDERQRRIRGERTNWLAILKLHVEAGHTERAESILERIDNSEFEADWQASLEIPLKMAVNLSANKRDDLAADNFKTFISLLQKMTVERIIANVMTEPKVIEINFNYKRNDSGASYIGAEQLKETVENLLLFSNRIIEFLDQVSNEFKMTTEKLTALRNYLEPFKGRQIKIEDYLNLRKTKIFNIQEFKDGCENLRKSHSQAQQEKLIAVILETEKSILREIFQANEKQL